MKDWSFKEGFAKKFDAHVREQLPWYELVTESVAYIARNYLPKNGLVYDIGASTGNMGLALDSLLKERKAKLIAIEEDEEMVEINRFNNPEHEVRFCNALTHNYQNFDVGVLMLTAMFFPAKEQADFFENLYYKLNNGGAIIVVDKSCDEYGYFSTVMKRLTMYWKLKNGATHQEILDKELSLSGIQRPLNKEYLQFNPKQFFQLGEFKGWVIEKL